MQSVHSRRLCLSVLLLITAVISGCAAFESSGQGTVLAEGKNLGEFQASPNPFNFDAASSRRYVITKVEVFGPGQLNGFPGDCSQGMCAAVPDEWPIVIISTKADPRCDRSNDEWFACQYALAAQCGRGEEAPHPPTYVWWARDSAGHREPHSCAYSGSALLGFVLHVRTPPTRISLVVQGRDVPIRRTP